MSFNPEKFDFTIPIPPITKHLGGEFIEYDFQNQKLVMSYKALNIFENPMGHLQGGMLCAMLDNSMGLFSIIANNGKLAATASMTTTFLRPCLIGNVIVNTYFIKSGKRILNIESVAYQEEKEVGRACAVFVPI